MTNYNWITDRRPTRADGDKDGYVIARCDPDNNDVLTYLHWSHPHWERVRYRLIPWRHTEIRQSPTAATPTPRKFASLSRTVTDFGHTIDAIDEDGVAWCMTVATDDSEPQWRQLLPLPGSEVVG
jgi:hypothetical protein